MWPHNPATGLRPPWATVVSAEPFLHGTGTLWCLQKEIATYRHWSVSLWRDRDDVSHCQILSPDKNEWRLISATLCGWRRCFVADQLWLMARIREEARRVPDCNSRLPFLVRQRPGLPPRCQLSARRWRPCQTTVFCRHSNTHCQSDAQQFPRQVLCRCRTTSLEQSAAQSQTMWAVIQPVQSVTGEIFIRTVRLWHSVNCTYLLISTTTYGLYLTIFPGGIGWLTIVLPCHDTFSGSSHL